MKFVIITPVRNEEKYIGTTIRRMIAQTLPPAEWIIVDDGSSDGTPGIIGELITESSFIKYLRLGDRGFRKPGQGVIDTFYAGFNEITSRDYDVIAKFDGDLDFPPHTLARIAEAFTRDPELGITGGTRYESRGNDPTIRRGLVPKGFVGGPYKFYRRQCFEDIDGLIRRAGWDGVDVIKAGMKGWKTGELEDLKILHLKPTGSARGEGLAKAYQKDGDINYYMGGHFWYFLLRVTGRSVQTKNPLVGYHMLKGYFQSWRRNVERESDEFRRHLKKVQINNMVYWFKLAFGLH